jgi:hypothetical protein
MPWSFEILDGAGGVNGRIDSDVGQSPAAILYDGWPHVFYRDWRNGNLRHAWWTGGHWMFETLDGEGGPNGRVNANLGGGAALVDRWNWLHVWYHQFYEGNLRHAWWDRQRWSFETLDGEGGPNGRIAAYVGLSISAVRNANDARIDVFHRDQDNGNLRHASVWNGLPGQPWSFETVDGTDGGHHGRINADVGLHSAAFVHALGRTHVLYYDQTNGNLRHGVYEGLYNGKMELNCETIDGAGGARGRIDAMVGQCPAVTRYNDEPHVFYKDDTNGNLRHAWWDSGLVAAHPFALTFQTLDGEGGDNGRINSEVGDFNAAILYDGLPHVFYTAHAQTNAKLRHAWWTVNTWMWNFETLDGDGGGDGRVNAVVGHGNAVTLYQGKPHVFYNDTTNGNLRHAWWS